MDPFAKRTVGRTKVEVTRLGMGGAPLGDLFDVLDEEACQATLNAAWESGIRAYDTAPWYGNTISEHRFGQMLRLKPRDEYMLSTKIGRVYKRAKNPETFDREQWAGGLTFQRHYDYTYDGVMRSWEDSLQRFGIPRVDILFIHDLDFLHFETEEGVVARLDELDTGGGVKALQELKDSGEIGAFGAGINREVMIPYFLDRFDLDVFLVAMPYTLIDQSPLDDIFPRCAERGMGVIIGSPYASGILAQGANPGVTYGYKPAEPEILDKVKKIEAVCARHNVPLKAAALQFVLHHPLVACIIPGPTAPWMVEDNVAMVKHEIPSALWADLKSEYLLRADAPTG